MQTSTPYYRDANHVPITNEGIITKKTITFAGGTTDAWGNDGGALDGASIFDVTGTVKAKVFGICTTDLTGATSTFEVGLTGATAIFLPITTCTDIDKDEIWFNSATPAKYFFSGERSAIDDNYPEYIINGLNIIGTVKTANITAGVIDFYCVWNPLSTNGNVAASSN